MLQCANATRPLNKLDAARLTALGAIFVDQAPHERNRKVASMRYQGHVATLALCVTAASLIHARLRESSSRAPLLFDEALKTGRTCVPLSAPSLAPIYSDRAVIRAKIE